MLGVLQKKSGVTVDAGGGVIETPHGEGMKGSLEDEKGDGR